MTPSAVEEKLTTEISEIFSSIQGEGIYLGKKQIFVRFGRCNLSCGYCDEKEKTGKGAWKTLTLEQVLRGVSSLEAAEGPHESVSLTGGEPLMYPIFLKGFLPKLKSMGFKTYLETNGTLPEMLRPFVPGMDIIAMDLKLPSAMDGKDVFEEHRAFLELARFKEVFVKVVVTSATLEEEIRRAAFLVAGADPSIPFVLQPETTVSGIHPEVMKKTRRVYFKEAREILKDVRVIPQMHKVWDLP